MRPGCLWFIIGGLGAGLAVGVYLFNQFGLPLIVDSQVGNTLMLKNNTEAWQRFVQLPVPLTFKIYVFEVLNPDNITKGAKPILRERGPYVYLENLKKVNLSINEGKDTVTYFQRYDIEFSQKLSGNLTEDDEVMVLNPIIAGLVSVIQSLPTVLSILTEILDDAIPVLLGDTPYEAIVKMKVSELLFKGYLLHCNQTEQTMAFLICSAIKRMLPMKIITLTPDDNLLLSILQFRNSTPEGPLEIYSGVKDPTKIGQLVSWEGKTHTNYWRGDPCNIVQGSDMTLLSPFVTRESTIRVFSTDICSSAKLVYKEDTSYSGVNGYRMVPGPDFLGDPKQYPEDACYCPTSLKNLTIPPDCMKKGVLDISGCLGVPAVLSLPHFLDADKEYSDKFEGLHPDPVKHSTFIDVEPLTGVPLQGYRRIQINLRTDPTSAVRVFNNITKSLFPIFWLEEGVMLGQDEVSMLNDQVLTVLYITMIVKWVMIAFGIFMTILGVAMGIIRKKNIKLF